ncbi:TnpV protein [Oscillibacter valericigenes]|uniref:TnpV protein n=1 Tax=Oscillibacter valericigenes TaxID=351091 RepID=A0ABS2FSL9_9FIRM|nr:TnpV protein [Oscillibacter valericigenes]
MELTYTQCGDYLIPDLVLSDTREYHIGKYGRMRRIYLKEHRPALYSTLLLRQLFINTKTKRKKKAGSYRKTKLL